MADRAAIVLDALTGIRRSPGYADLALGERRTLDRDLKRIEETFRTGDPYAMPSDYATALDDNDLERDMAAREQAQRSPPATSTNTQPAPAAAPANKAPAPAAAPATGTEVLGARARQALDAVDFPSFVASLVTGTFRSIVDATSQQVRDYAALVASISKSVDEFSQDNVTPNQVRDWLLERYPKDLALILPDAGKEGTPRLVPRPGRPQEPPAWLSRYGLDGQDFTEELTDGALIDAARPSLGDERLQTLATMVLMGINRIVVSDGQIRAKLQFHAAAQEKVTADIQQGGGQQSIAGASGASGNVTTMVSTINVNAQADIAIKAELSGEVMIQFRTETFPLDKFADSAAIQLINRHAKWQGDGAAKAAGGAPAVQSPPAATAPAHASAGAPKPNGAGTP